MPLVICDKYLPNLLDNSTNPDAIFLPRRRTGGYQLYRLEVTPEDFDLLNSVWPSEFSGSP